MYSVTEADETYLWFWIEVLGQYGATWTPSSGSIRGASHQHLRTGRKTTDNRSFRASAKAHRRDIKEFGVGESQDFYT